MMQRAVDSWLLVLVTLSALGCGVFGDRPAAEARKPHEPLIAPLDARKLGYSLSWGIDLGVPLREALAHVEVLGDVVVCIETPSNIVTAMAARDGQILWRRVVGKPADGLFAPVRSGDKLLINSEQLVYCLAIDTGDLEKVTVLESLVDDAPAVVEGLAVFGGMNHRVFAHDAQAGYTKWSYQLTDRVFARPTAFGENVFVADGNGVYAMFDARNGQLQWKGRAHERVSAQPAISHVGVFLPGEDHNLYAIHGATGRDRWIYHTTQPLVQNPQIYGNLVLLPLPGEGLVALDTRSGEEKWKLSFVAEPILQRENSLLIHAGRRLILMELETGVSLLEVPVQPVERIIAGPEGRVILVSPTGRLLLLAPLSS